MKLKGFLEKKDSEKTYLVQDKDRKFLCLEKSKDEVHFAFIKYPDPLTEVIWIWSADKDEFREFLEESIKREGWPNDNQEIIKNINDYTFKDYEDQKQEEFDMLKELELIKERYLIYNTKGEVLCVEEILDNGMGYPEVYPVFKEKLEDHNPLVFWCTDVNKLRVYLDHLSDFDRSEDKHGISEIFKDIDSFTFKKMDLLEENQNPYKVDETDEKYIMMTKSGLVYCECDNVNDEDRFPRIELLHPTDVTYYDPVAYHTNTFKGFVARMKAYQERTHLVYDPFKKFNLTEDDVVFMKLSEFKAKYYWGFWKRDMEDDFDAVDEESQFVIENDKGEIFGISWETGEPVFQPLFGRFKSIPCFSVAVWYNDIQDFMRHFGPSLKAWGKTVDPGKLKFREVTGEYDHYEFVEEEGA